MRSFLFLEMYRCGAIAVFISTYRGNQYLISTTNVPFIDSCCPSPLAFASGANITHQNPQTDPSSISPVLFSLSHPLLLLMETLILPSCPVAVVPGLVVKGSRSFGSRVSAGPVDAKINSLITCLTPVQDPTAVSAPIQNCTPTMQLSW